MGSTSAKPDRNLYPSSTSSPNPNPNAYPNADFNPIPSTLTPTPTQVLELKTRYENGLTKLLETAVQVREELLTVTASQAEDWIKCWGGRLPLPPLAGWLEETSTSTPTASFPAQPSIPTLRSQCLTICAP